MKQTGSQNRSRVTGGRPKGRLMAAALLLTVAFMGIVPATSSAVDPSFVPVLIAGGGVLGHGTDGDSAVCVSAPGCAGEAVGRIMYPIGMAVHPTSGEFFFSQGSLESASDLPNNFYRSIRRIKPDGTLQTVVGDNLQVSECKSNCDGEVDTSKQQLRTPGHMVFNSNGSALYVLDGENGVREVTFAGNPPLPTTISTRTYTSHPDIADLKLVTGGLAIDGDGSLYFGARFEPLRLSVMKLTSTGALTELISSVAGKAPTMKRGQGQFNGPLDVKVVGDDLYVLYDNKLIRTDLDGTLEAEYTLQAEYILPTQIHYKSFAVVGGTVYVGRTGLGFKKIDGEGTILSFSDDASTSVAASPTLTPFIGTTAGTTFSFNTDRSQIELTGPRSMMVHNGGLYISDMKADSKFIEFSVILALMPPPVISPATQIVSGQVGTAIAASTGFTESNFSGAVTYSSETLPAGLTLDSDTGVISGTPTAVSTATVTITATGATSGTATATVTFAISAAPTPPAPAEIVPPAPAEIVPPAPETTAPPTTAAPGNAPTLVSADNQTALTRTPGSATALVNGQPVEVEVRSLADSTGAQTAPEDRSPEQVAELQQAAVAVTDRLAAVAGGDIGIEVIATDTGAELSGVFPDMNIPVEDVIVVDVGESATLFAARSPSGDIIKVQPGAVLEVTPEGEVAVIAYGLPVGDQVELVLMSTPTLLGTFIVDASGAIEILANIPDAIGSGDHTLVVASPNVQASLGLTVSDLTQPSAMELPATGTSPANGLVIIMLAMGGLLVLATRRRNMRID